jgi:hypothetical protein
MAQIAEVAGFLPSTSGFHFANDFPSAPLKVIPIEFHGASFNVDLGDASKGLCGGMVFAVRDYFEKRLAPPTMTSPPGDGPLFAYLKERLLDSWGVTGGPNGIVSAGAESIIRYLELMNPTLPDHDVVVLGKVVLTGRYSQMINQWPLVKGDIDAGYLSPLGVIKTKSSDPAQLGLNHQVLAYRYELDGDNLTLGFYDPNYPDKNDASLSLNLADPSQVCNVACTTAPTVYCFFRSTYIPPADSPPGGTPL